MTSDVGFELLRVAGALACVAFFFRVAVSGRHSAVSSALRFGLDELVVLDVIETEGIVSFEDTALDVVVVEFDATESDLVFETHTIGPRCSATLMPSPTLYGP